MSRYIILELELELELVRDINIIVMTCQKYFAQNVSVRNSSVRARED